MKQARVLFDEFHSEAWSVRPEVAERMQPAHPGDSSYAPPPQALAAHHFTAAPHTHHPLTPPKGEFPPDGGPPRLSDDELDAIDDFVRAGGGLIVLAETEQDKY